MTENDDDNNWQDHDDDEASDCKSEDSDGMSSQANNLNGLPNKVTVPESSSSGISRSGRSISSRGSVSSKSTSSRTRRQNERLRLRIERLRKVNDRLRTTISAHSDSSTRSSSSKSRNRNDQSRKGDSNHSRARRNNGNHISHGEQGSHDGSSSSTFTRSTRRSSTRRENKRLRLENERIRSELTELQRNLEAALLQSNMETSGVPSAVPIPDIVEVEVFRPTADREELLRTRVERLTNLVQALLVDNEDLRLRVGKKSGVGSGGSVATTTTIVEPSLWKKHRCKILLGGAVLVVAGAVAYVCWPVSAGGGAVRIAQVMIRHGVAAKASIETVKKAATYSIDGAITRIVQVSQSGVGLPEDGDYF